MVQNLIHFPRVLLYFFLVDYFQVPGGAKENTEFSLEYK